ETFSAKIFSAPAAVNAAWWASRVCPSVLTRAYPMIIASPFSCKIFAQRLPLDIKHPMAVHHLKYLHSLDFLRWVCCSGCCWSQFKIDLKPLKASSFDSIKNVRSNTRVDYARKNQSRIQRRVRPRFQISVDFCANAGRKKSMTLEACVKASSESADFLDPCGHSYGK